MQQTTLTYQGSTGWTACNAREWDSPHTLILAFAAPEFALDQAPIMDLKNRFPQSLIVGCSTAGEIAGDALCDESISAAVVRFERTQIKGAVAAVAKSDDSYGAGVRLGVALDHHDLRAVFILSDGLKVNGSELVRGLNEILPEGVVITGGLAGDGPNFNQTFTFMGDHVMPGHVCAVGFYGDHIQVGHASRGGWDKFGHEREITRSKGNVLYEIDGKPALDLYKDYLGDKAADLPASALLFPLQIWNPVNHPTPVVRTILGVDEATKSMTFAGDVPTGSTAQFLYANFDRVIAGAADAAEACVDLDSESVLAIAISCVGRRLVLSDRTEEEIEAVLEVLPRGSNLIGFYSYGEISPVPGGHCDLHNQSMTLTTFSEAA